MWGELSRLPYISRLESLRRNINIFLDISLQNVTIIELDVAVVPHQKTTFSQAPAFRPGFKEIKP